MSYSEAVLMERFQEWLAAKLVTSYTSPPVLIREFDDGFSRPDLVQVRTLHMPQCLPVEVFAHYLAYPRYTNLLAQLKLGAPTTFQSLLRNFGDDRKYDIKRRLGELSEAGLVTFLDKERTVALTCHMPEFEIITYEGKLTNLKRALWQACKYLVYSHSVRIVVPAHTAKNALNSEDVFKSIGYGLISAQNDWQFRRQYPSRKRRPRNRARRFYAAGKVLQRLLADETPTNFVVA